MNKNCEKISNYKGTVIKARMGIYRQRGSPELLHNAYKFGFQLIVGFFII